MYFKPKESIFKSSKWTNWLNITIVVETTLNKLDKTN